MIEKVYFHVCNPQILVAPNANLHPFQRLLWVKFLGAFFAFQPNIDTRITVKNWPINKKKQIAENRIQCDMSHTGLKMFRIPLRLLGLPFELGSASATHISFLAFRQSKVVCCANQQRSTQHHTDRRYFMNGRNGIRTDLCLHNNPLRSSDIAMFLDNEISINVLAAIFLMSYFFYFFHFVVFQE